MNGVFKDLGIAMKGEKSVFNVLSDEDLMNLSAFSPLSIYPPQLQV
jgi:hypothetical protein